jgi:phosphatidylglycerol lysyltransferase
MMKDTIRKQWHRTRISAEAGTVHIIAILTALTGVVNIASVLMPALADRMALLRRFLPLEVRHGSHLATTLAGFALLLLSVNLWRRKQTAWLLTEIALLVAAIGNMLKGLDYEVAILALALGVVLFVLRPHYHARSDPPSIRSAGFTALAALGFTLVYGTVGFFLLDRHIGVKFDFPGALRQTVVMFTQFTDTGLQPATGFGRYFVNSIYIVAAATLGYSLLLLGRPVLVRQPATPAERARALSIVGRYGASALARFTLLEDKSYYFSPGGSSISYVVKGRVALALGDPIGPEEDFPVALAGFKTDCERNDWQPAFYQTPPETLEIFKAAGFSALTIGQEAIVDLAAFTTEGGAGKEWRNTNTRLSKLGLRVETHLPPLGPGLVDELRLISDAWLTMMHGTELRFANGWFDDDYVRQSTVLAVHRPDGDISAFGSLVPEYRRNETAVDLMRRLPGVENGTMDFLFVALFSWAKAQGLATFSLGLSALAGVGEHSAAPRTERALRYLYDNVNRFYNFKGLHAYKEKFHPRWEPRFLIYPGAASLPAVATALVRANSGDNFLWAYLRPQGAPVTSPSPTP